MARKPGCIVKRGAGYAVVLDLGKGPDGKRRRKWHSGFNTKKEAEAFLKRVLHEVETGEYVEPAKLTVGELMQRFLDDYCAHRLKPSTLAGYTYSVRRHILPALGGLKLAKLSPLHLQAFYSDKLEEGLSRRTVQQLHAIVHKALECAVKWQLVGRNVADAVEAPRPERKEIMPLTAEDVARFLAVAQAENPRMYPFWLLAVHTGMRKGELLALTWDAVDLARGTIEVRQSMTEAFGKLVVTAPKTAKGKRLIELTPPVVEALRKHRHQQKKERLAFGPDYQDNGLVFCQINGKPYHPNAVTRWHFKRLLRKAGLPNVRFHDLRHTCATLLLKQGVHPKVVQERLGHANIGITLDTYSHLVPGIQREAGAKLDAILFGKEERRQV